MRVGRVVRLGRKWVLDLGVLDFSLEIMGGYGGF